MKQPTFVQVDPTAETDAVEDLSQILVRLSGTTMVALDRAMSDPTTPAAIKV
jgi:hypothetical protein